MVDGISHVYLHEICRSFMSTSTNILGETGTNRLDRTFQFE